MSQAWELMNEGEDESQAAPPRQTVLQPPAGQAAALPRVTLGARCLALDCQELSWRGPCKGSFLELSEGHNSLSRNILFLSAALYSFIHSLSNYSLGTYGPQTVLRARKK